MHKKIIKNINIYKNLDVIIYTTYIWQHRFLVSVNWRIKKIMLNVKKETFYILKYLLFYY